MNTSNEINNTAQTSSIAMMEKPLKTKKPRKTFKKKASIDLYQVVTDQVVELLELHGSDWVQSWVSKGGLPVNISSGNNYNGINVLLLGISAHKQNFDSNLWGTYKQWSEKGGTVKKGSKGTKGVFFKTLEFEETAEEDSKKIPFLRGFVLFNADQVDGVDLPATESFENSPIETAQKIIDDTGAVVEHLGSRAFYRASSDSINMPALNSFFTSTDYYLTAFHELTHWTAHKSRLDRDLKNRFGDDGYAVEELIAELGAAFLGASSGLSVTPREDHIKYLNSWLKVLKTDKKAIFTASSKAQKAVDFILENDDQKKAVK